VGDTGNDIFNINNNWSGTLAGTDGDDTFTFADGVTVNAIDGGSGIETSGDLIDISAWTGAQTVDLQGSTIAGVITTTFSNVERFTGDGDGGAGLDILLGDNTPNDFNITGADDGDIDGVITFTDFANLTAGTGGDRFDFNGGSISGVITGNTGTDILDYGDVVLAVTIDLANSSATNVNGGAASGFSSIESFIGDSTNDTLIGANGNNTWTITGVDDGDIGGAITFTDINDLQGGTADDAFVFAAAGSLSGSINGAADTTNDSIDISAVAGVNTVDLQNSTISGGILGGTFSNIEAFTGDGGGGAGLDILLGDNADNTFNLTGSDTGNIDGTIIFTDFANLSGGVGNDILDFGTVGDLTGNATVETLDYGSWTTSAVTFDIGATTSSGIGGT
ncbi:MAG: hypothetical protein GWN45_02100, partial [Gammaproteobacteria bacterium]|nr:hypothetical protein [Gammaproteobacteria bacterium]